MFVSSKHVCVCDWVYCVDQYYMEKFECFKYIKWTIFLFEIKIAMASYYISN